MRLRHMSEREFRENYSLGFRSNLKLTNENCPALKRDGICFGPHRVLVHFTNQIYGEDGNGRLGELDKVLEVFYVEGKRVSQDVYETELNRRCLGTYEVLFGPEDVKDCHMPSAGPELDFSYRFAAVTVQYWPMPGRNRKK